MHHVFNGVDLLEIMLSMIVGAVWALRVAKVTRDYDNKHRSDTPIADRVAHEMGLRYMLAEINKK